MSATLMQPSHDEIQREVENLRDIKRRSTLQGGPGVLILDPDLPLPAPRPQLPRRATGTRATTPAVTRTLTKMSPAPILPRTTLSTSSGSPPTCIQRLTLASFVLFSRNTPIPLPKLVSADPKALSTHPSVAKSPC